MNPLLIIGGALALLALMGGKKRGNTATIDNAELYNAFDRLKARYGADFARKIERLFRLETAHFKSGQFKESLSAGMEGVDGKDRFPFGWSSLQSFVDAHPELGSASDYFLVPMKDNHTGKERMFVGFPNVESSVLFTGYVVDKRGGDPGSWHSTDPNRKAEYNRRLQSVRTDIVDSL